MKEIKLELLMDVQKYFSRALTKREEQGKCLNELGASIDDDEINRLVDLAGELDSDAKQAEYLAMDAWYQLHRLIKQETE